MRQTPAINATYLLAFTMSDRAAWEKALKHEVTLGSLKTTTPEPQSA
jgi:hypothetical protein